MAVFKKFYCKWAFEKILWFRISITAHPSAKRNKDRVVKY